jgi:hypothetical protein
MKKQIIILLLISYWFSGCEEEIRLDVNQTIEQIVIEGLLTDSLRRHVVKISTTNNLYDTGEFPKVNNASVRVTEITSDGQENHFDYIQEGKDGYYYSETAFSGKLENSYKLEVVWEGKVFEATDVLLPVAPIDSLVPRLIDPEDVSDETKDSLGTEFGPFYEILFYAVEPPERVDYYHWRFYRNGVFKNFEGDAVFYASDELVRSEINGIIFPGIYTKGDTVYQEQYSLTRNGYLYFFDLETVLFSDGGMFSPPPANPRTNLSNGALGFWQVSALETFTYVVP